MPRLTALVLVLFAAGTMARADEKNDPELAAQLAKLKGTPAPAQAGFPVDMSADQKQLEVRFPSGDANWETAWKIVWDMETVAQARRQGFTFPEKRDAKRPVLFKVKKAYFKPGRQAPWIQVLDDAHVSE